MYSFPYRIDRWLLFCNNSLLYTREIIIIIKNLYIRCIKNKQKYNDIERRGSYAIHHPSEATAASQRHADAARNDLLATLNFYHRPHLPYIIIIE